MRAAYSAGCSVMHLFVRGAFENVRLKVCFINGLTYLLTSATAQEEEHTLPGHFQISWLFQVL